MFDLHDYKSPLPLKEYLRKVINIAPNFYFSFIGTMLHSKLIILSRSYVMRYGREKHSCPKGRITAIFR
jgi:hypothetical protein